MAALHRAASDQQFAKEVTKVIVVDKVDNGGRDRSLDDWCADSTTIFAQYALKEVAFALGLPSDETPLKFAELENSYRFLASRLRQPELPHFDHAINNQLFMRDYLSVLKQEALNFLTKGEKGEKAPFPAIQLAAFVRQHLCEVINFDAIDMGRAASGTGPLFSDVADQAKWDAAANQLAAAFNAQRSALAQKQHDQNALEQSLQRKLMSSVQQQQPRAAGIAPQQAQQPAAPQSQQQQQQHQRRQTAAKTLQGLPLSPPRTQPGAPPVAAAIAEENASQQRAPRPPRRSNSRNSLTSSAIIARDRERRRNGDWPAEHPRGTLDGACANIVNGAVCGSSEHCKYDCPNYTCPLCHKVAPGHAAVVLGVNFCPEQDF